ncbi:MAG: T9SS type A sorting domain-containing protein [Paludibacteraceae bacterium]|nr:T9SS type A sorting domain-containing protein [Paludibacteraceae bacterium]
MKHFFLKINVVLFFFIIIGINSYAGTKQMEYLDRGVVAVKVNNGVFISWRFLGTDDKSTGFNIYRDGTKINDAPITTKTNYVDTKGSANSKYVIKAVVGGVETEASKATIPWGEQYKTLTLKRPGNNYAANDMSVGDVDGDGQYELFVKWYPNNAKDNSQSGKTDNTLIDCYKLDGTFLWRINLGINIRSGAHYTQFQVYDYDGDGKCEMVCKTAPGTKDGKGKNVIMGNDNPNADYRNGNGYVLDGPEYLTIFDGETGAEIHTVKYTPERGNVSAWGDSYGNRVDRFNACTAYLDGVHPSVVMCRGYYTRTTLAAYDFKNKKLVQRWYHNSDKKGQGAYGDGNHNVSVADVDGDGKDEIILGSAIIDDDGKTYSRTGFGHGDAMHVSDMDPDRAGLEGWFVHEDKGAAYGYEMRDLKNNKVIHGKKTGTDNGRGMAADIDAKYRGFEMWSSAPGVFDCKGKQISSNKPSVNFRIYWDGDLQDELLDGTKCDKWNGNGVNRLITFKGNACNGTKNTPCLSADLFGDWREEVIYHDGDKIYIYTTTIESKYRLFTLMHDPVYRCAIAWQNSSYNQPPHLGFYIGDGVDKIDQPDIYLNGDHSTVQPTKATMEVIGNLTQEVFSNEPISNLSFTSGGTATDIKTSTVIAGLKVEKKENTITISGTPTESGTMTIETVGGENVIKQTFSVNIINTDSKKRIAYITDESNDNFANDKILPMLKECTDLYVRVIDANLSNINLSVFDMVVISEETASSAPIMAMLEGLAKPMLSMKVHGYKNADGAWGWATTGYGDNTTETNIVVNNLFKNHPMFKDVTFINGNEIKMVNEVNTKALTYMNPESFTDATGNISSIASIKGEEQISILEIKEGSSIAGTKINEPYIQIGLNSSSYGNITEDGLSVIKNACYYLMGMNQEGTSIENIESQKEVSLYPNPMTEYLIISYPSETSKNITLSITDMAGRVVLFESFEVHAGENSLRVERGALATGEYILSFGDLKEKIIIK